MAADDRRIANGQGNYTLRRLRRSEEPRHRLHAGDVQLSIDSTAARRSRAFKGAPGGDDPQQMWIDPTDGQRMFLGVDQGATISLDGGQTWSSWYNQATAQVYHISTDTSVSLLGLRDAAGQRIDRHAQPRQPRRDHVARLAAASPATSSAHRRRSAESRTSSTPAARATGIVKITYAERPVDQRQPERRHDGARCAKSAISRLICSPTNPHELLAGFQYLMSTTDGGDALEEAEPRPRLSEGRDAAAAAPPAAGRPRRRRRRAPPLGVDRIDLAVERRGRHDLGRHQQRPDQGDEAITARRGTT